ncbi:IS3 family transposase [Bradyrhizobium elkanii]|uniref:IS3 family transposase n=1 Tax=Bradyrhizobium elkanii TaxID=29448 RepID=UPI002011222B|nr:IS3 family transposase [Bradyrhizobium elkanii]
MQRENERLRMEQGHFQKVYRDFCWNTDIRFIEDRRADYPVTLMFDALGVSAGRLICLELAPGEPTICCQRNLVDDIRRVHRDTRGRYGSPRIHVELKARGRGASRARPPRAGRRVIDHSDRGVQLCLGGLQHTAANPPASARR